MNTVKSNTDYVAEAVAAIPLWRAYLEQKDAEVDAQIAQLREEAPLVEVAAAAGGAGNTSPPSGAAPEVRPEASIPATGADTLVGVAAAVSSAGLGGVSRVGAALGSTGAGSDGLRGAEPAGSGSRPVPAASEGSPATVAAEDHAAHTARPSGDREAGARATLLPTPEQPVAERALDASDLVAEFEAALADVDTINLPLVVQDALAQRRADPTAFAQALVAAQQRGQLPDRLSRAVGNLGEVDYTFRDAEALYRSGSYPELFPTDDPAELSDGREAPLLLEPTALAARFGAEYPAPTHSAPADPQVSGGAWQSEAEADLHVELAHHQDDLPRAVADALHYRRDDPDALPQALVAAQHDGQLPDELGLLVDELELSDGRFADAAERYAAGERDAY